MVEDGRGTPIAAATLWFEGEEPGPGGRLLIGGSDHLIHADEQGRFELALARTPRVTVRVYIERNQGPALTHAFEPLRDEETLLLVVP